jgi:hypothetical protein
VALVHFRLGHIPNTDRLRVNLSVPIKLLHELAKSCFRKERGWASLWTGVPYRDCSIVTVGADSRERDGAARTTTLNGWRPVSIF